MSDFLYVNNNTRPNSVTAYRIADNGSLTELPESPFPTNGDSGNIGFETLSATIAVAFGKLYISNSLTQNVSGFNINTDGSLTPLPGSPFNTNTDVAAGIAVATNKRVLYVSSTCSQTAAFNIQTDGTLSPLPGSPFGPFLGTGFMSVINREETLLFSDCRTQLIASLIIPPDGSLVEVPGSPFETRTFNNHGLALSSDSQLLFVCGGADPRVEVFSVAPNGTLSRVPCSPFPAQVDDPFFCAVHPAENLLFVSDAISNNLNLALFTFDSTGSLTPVANSPFANGGAGTHMLELNEQGTLLFSANALSRDVSVLTIDEEPRPIPGSPFPGVTGPASGISQSTILQVTAGRSLFPIRYVSDHNFSKRKWHQQFPRT